MIELKGISKYYGADCAADSVSLRIERGSFFALLGPSGCGKTTLLRIMAGFVAPGAGQVLLDGQDVTDLPAWQRPVNMMFQSYALFPHMTVEGNIRFGLKQDGRLSRAEIDSRIEEMLNLLELKPYARRKPHQLSGGQSQRVALARALAKRPAVLLLDEPLGALDRRLRERTQLELMDIQERLGTTFVIVTHDQEEAMVLSTHMAVMNAGKILQIGTPTEIYEYPRNRQIAEFLGKINLIPAQFVRLEGEKSIFSVWQEELEIHAKKNEKTEQTISSMTPGAPVWLAIRPEKMTLHNSTAGAPEGLSVKTSGIVEDIVYRGASTGYQIRLRNRDLIHALLANPVLRMGWRAKWDDEVIIGFHADNALILPREQESMPA